MRHFVLKIGGARLNQLRRARRVIGIQKTPLRHIVAAGHNVDEPPAVGPPQPHKKARVALVIHRLVIRRVRPQPVPVDAHRTMMLVQHGIVQRPVVVAPHQAVVGVGYRIRQRGARLQVNNADGEPFRPVKVHAVGRQPVVGAVLKPANARVIPSLRQPVHIQQRLLRPVGAAPPPAVDGILPALLKANIVVVLALLLGHGIVILLDAPPDFGVQRFLPRAQGLQKSLRVGVFGPQVRHRRRVVRIPQPAPGVGTGVAVSREGIGTLRRNGSGGHLVRRSHRIVISSYADYADNVARWRNGANGFGANGERSQQGLEPTDRMAPRAPHSSPAGSARTDSDMETMASISSPR